MRDTFGPSSTPCSLLLKHARHTSKEPEGTREASLSCGWGTKRKRALFPLVIEKGSERTHQGLSSSVPRPRPNSTPYGYACSRIAHTRDPREETDRCTTFCGYKDIWTRAGRTALEDYASSSRRQAPPCSLDRCQIRPRCMGCSYRSFGSAWCCFRLRRARRKVREQAADRRPAESLDAECRGQMKCTSFCLELSKG